MTRGARRAAAAGMLLVLLGLPPLLLTVLVGPPWPRTWPTRLQVEQWLADPLTPTTVLFALVFGAWLAWLLLVAAVAAEAAARLRSGARRLRRLPLPTPLQTLADGLVGATVLTTGTSTHAQAATVDRVTAADAPRQPSAQAPRMPASPRGQMPADSRVSPPDR